MTGVVEGFRWALLGKSPAPGPMLAVSVVTVALLCLSGLHFFRRMEKSFGDLA
jgi:lipopolysaccharide transport system permease protein